MRRCGRRPSCATRPAPGPCWSGSGRRPPRATRSSWGRRPGRGTRECDSARLSVRSTRPIVRCRRRRSSSGAAASSACSRRATGARPPSAGRSSSPWSAARASARRAWSASSRTACAGVSRAGPPHRPLRAVRARHRVPAAGRGPARAARTARGRPGGRRPRAAGRSRVLALTLGIDAAGELSPLAAREALHRGWVSLLAEIAHERPLALLVEDLHWAQDGLLDLLERVLDEVDAPLAVVATGTARVARAPAVLGPPGNAETAWLEPLAADDAAAMLDALAVDLAADIRTKPARSRRGQPVLPRGAARGIGEPGRPIRQPIPDSVQAVLAARIDLLAPLRRPAVQAASVIGRSFWAGPVTRDAGRRGARPGRARGARLRAARAGVRVRGRARARVQACAYARRRLRVAGRRAARAPARRVRRLARARGRRARRGCRVARAPLRGGRAVGDRDKAVLLAAPRR